MHPLLSDLNRTQAEAVEQIEGPLLILAGAGTGKTKTLTTRIAYLLATKRTFPSRILAVTFTNKAAQEMRQRVINLIGETAEALPWLGTFHAICARILRRHAEAVGLKPDFTILNADDQKRLVKQIIKARNLDEKRHPAGLILHHIERWKDRGLCFDGLAATDISDPIRKLSADIWKIYQPRLKQLNAADFGDLINECLVLFRQDTDVLAEWKKKFEFVMVDEYQDTNLAQNILLQSLTGTHKNICCVGDDDQSIYGWRGAEITNILQFQKKFPEAKVIRLEQNYRSTKHILSAANSLIGHNQNRLGKDLWTNIEGGEKIHVQLCADGKDESHLICGQLAQAHLRGEVLDQMAILVRASFQIREFEERCLALNLPYRIIGASRFYERAEIRDANAYLRLIMQGADDLAFQRIINLPRRGLGEKSLTALADLAQSQNLSLLAAAALPAEKLQAAGIQKRACVILNDFAARVARWREEARNQAPDQFVAKMLEQSGIMQMWQSRADADGRVENLNELVRAISEFGSLADYLEHVALVMEMEPRGSQSKDCVNIMTLHAAKGLEFERVFLPGWEEEIFPHRRALEEENGLEEERRLAYVGLTRAKQQATITFALSRLVFNEWRSPLPSRFIEEIGAQHIILHERFSQRGAQDTSDMVGARVYHEHFGEGTITAADGDNLTIIFDDCGSKMVKAGFIKKL